MNIFFSQCVAASDVFSVPPLRGIRGVYPQYLPFLVATID
jgi:hypothetical protein